LAELNFYKREYQLPVQPTDTVMQGLKILEKDHAQRLRGATVGNGNFFMQLDPVSGMKVFSSKNQSLTQYGNGANIKGFLGKHFNFQFYYRDITESGKGIDYNKTSPDELGIIKNDTYLHNSLN